MSSSVHRPLYAILDECTSAVSVDAEIGLYNTANKLGITYVRIGRCVGAVGHFASTLRVV